VLYAYYDWRLTQNEDRVGDLAEGLETRLSDANVAVENATNEAVRDVREEGEALRALIADQNRIVELQPQISASVWYVSTLDDSGRASVGSAFVVAGDGDGSLLLTSYATVSASTVDPAPEITLRKGDETMVATLYAWDPARDLALLTVDRPDMEPLTWANEEQRAAAAGKRGFVVSGLGGSDATFSPGQVLDLTATGIMHNVAISEQFQGGPLLDEAGNVLGVASMEYNPLNFESTGAVSFAVPVGLACEQVLTCNGDATGAG
jgi:S1-C subfamily serine protease